MYIARQLRKMTIALPKTRLITARINRDDFLRRCQSEKTKKHTFMNNARAAQAGARAERVQPLFSSRPLVSTVSFL